MELKAKIIKSGTWLYDGVSAHEVWIVQQNFDYYDEEGYEDELCVQPDETIYQVLFAQQGNVQSVLPACRSMNEAIALAEEKCSKIIWDDHRMQPLFKGRYYSLEE